MEATQNRRRLDETVVKTNQPGIGVGAGGGGESSRRPPPAASAFSSDVGGGGPLSAAASPGSSDVSIFVSAPTSFSFSGVASASPIVSRPPSLPLPHHSNIMLPRVCPAEVCAEIESEEPCAPPGPWVATRRTRARGTRKSERPRDSSTESHKEKKRQKVQNVRE